MLTPKLDVIRAIEAKIDLLTLGFQKTDISSLSDLLTDTTVLMPPEGRTAKGRAVSDQFRNMAQAVEAFKILSTEMWALGDVHVCDAGTLSFRRRQTGHQSVMRYMMIWQQEGPDWKLARMIWNRETPAEPARRAGQSSGAASRALASANAEKADDGLGDM